MDVDEGMIVTVEELGAEFVVTDIVGDYTVVSEERRTYYRIDSMRLVPLRTSAKQAKQRERTQ